jgi:glycerophosphoryl diester phosphodiesterase
MNKRVPLRIAHGYGNTPALIRAALDSRVDLIEGDVRLRRGRLMLAHDRWHLLWWFLTGKRAGWAVLSLFLFWRSRKRPQVDHGPLPLEDLLAMAAGRRGVLLDLKMPLLSRNRRRFGELLIASLRRLAEGIDVRLSGDWPLLDAIRQALPEIPLYDSVAGNRRWRAFIWRVEAGDPLKGISLKTRLFDAPTAQFLAGKGIEVLCWPVDDAAEADRVIALGAGGVTSYDLALLARIGGAVEVERG